jgi:hypothetical protein
MIDTQYLDSLTEYTKFVIADTAGMLLQAVGIYAAALIAYWVLIP